MKKTKSISDKTLEVIRKNKVKPIPRWEFKIKNWGLTGLWLVNVALGGAAVSVVLFMLGNEGRGLEWTERGGLRSIIENLPYFWLITTIFLTITAYYFFKKTRKSYRYETVKIVGLELLASLLLGILLHVGGFDRRIDMAFEENIPYYRQVAPMKWQTWMNPEGGFLAGIMGERLGQDKYLFTDFGGKKWVLETEGFVLRGRASLDDGQQVKLIGFMDSKNIFKVNEVRPWIGRGGQNR